MGDKTSKCEYSSVQVEASQPADVEPDPMPEFSNPEELLHPTAEVPIEMPHLDPELFMAQEGNERVEEPEAGEEVEPQPENELPSNEQPLLPPGNDPN